MLFGATHFYYSCEMIEMERLRRRAAIVRSIREFFDERGYLAVDTPILARAPIPEAHIKPLRTRTESYDGGTHTELSLLPSPEYYLKRLLAAGAGSLYEIGHAFRGGEPPSGVHSAEFTMLEYYTVGVDGDDSIPITLELLDRLGVSGDPLVLTMDEAWRRWAGLPLEPFLPSADVGHDRAAAELARRAVESGAIGDGGGDAEWEDTFHRVLVNAIEPSLPRDRPVILTCYPDAIPTLARQIPGTRWADRWELYLDGVEIANCYGEETDAERVRAFFDGERARIAEREGIPPPTDEAFIELELPRCSGVALGVDRLVAAIVGDRSIDRVISFFDFY